MSDRHFGRRHPPRIVRRTCQPRKLRQQHLQRQDRQHRTQHSSSVPAPPEPEPQSQRGGRDNREGGRGDRNRDNRGQGQFTPVEIPPGSAQPGALNIPVAAPADDDFGAGIEDESPTTAPAPAPQPQRPQGKKHPIPQRPTAPVAEAPLPKSVEEDDEFGAGIDEDLTEETKPAPVTPKPVAAVPIAPAEELAETETEVEDTAGDDDDFGAGLDFEEEEASDEEEEETEDTEDTPKKTTKKPAAKKPTAKKAPAKKVVKKAKPVEEKETKKAKPKRVVKKTKPTADETSEEEAKPQAIEGEARRTTGDEDGFSFDPYGPNDRFGDSGSAEEKPAQPKPDFTDDDLEFGPPPKAPQQPADNFEDDDYPPPNFNNQNRGGRDGGRGDGRDRDRGGRDGGRGGRDGGRRDGGRGGRDGGRRDGGGGGGRGRDRDDDDRDGTKAPPIETIFKRGQEVIVQVIKEGMGTKCPTLSTHISIAGRYLVLAPWLGRIAVSRKIADDRTRQRLKQIMNELNAPKGIGFIIRTAAVDKDVTELQKDLTYLVKLWDVFCNKTLKRTSPSELHSESDMVTRTIRDIFTSDVDAIYIDSTDAFNAASDFMKVVMPRYADRLHHHTDVEPLFHRFGIESEVQKLQDKRVPLSNGGSLVIEQTEALVAIDVNSGTFRQNDDAEETAYQMNMAAAKEIARQLRLRNLGGVIINDFIDMKEERHKRSVEQTLRNALRRDRARTKILKTSAFGVIEMTRQRVQGSLKKSAYQECGHCHGSGHVKTPESMGIELMRILQLVAHQKQAKSLELSVHVEVAQWLLNRKRREITRWEDEGEMQVAIHGVTGVSPEHIALKAFDAGGSEISTAGLLNPPKTKPNEKRQDRDRDQDDEDGRDGGGRDGRGGNGGGRDGRDRDRGGNGGGGYNQGGGGRDNRGNGNRGGNGGGGHRGGGGGGHRGNGGGGNRGGGGGHRGGGGGGRR